MTEVSPRCSGHLRCNCDSVMQVNACIASCETLYKHCRCIYVPHALGPTTKSFPTCCLTLLLTGAGSRQVQSIITPSPQAVRLWSNIPCSSCSAGTRPQEPHAACASGWWQTWRLPSPGRSSAAQQPPAQQHTGWLTRFVSHCNIVRNDSSCATLRPALILELVQFERCQISGCLDEAPQAGTHMATHFQLTNSPSPAALLLQ